MTVTSAEVSAYAIARTASGHITQFGLPALGYVQLHGYTFTYSGGELSGQTISVCALGVSVQAESLSNDSIMKLPGGRTFSPWTAANERIPTHYPLHTQRVIAQGNVAAVHRWIYILQSFVGISASLHFAYGRRYPGSTYGAKACTAVMMPVSQMVERLWDTANTTDKTHITLTLQWQQVSDFWSP